MENQIEIKKFAELSKEFPNAVVSYSHLRIENKIANNKSVYQFPILTQGNESTTEVKLDKNDTFHATKMSLGIIERNTTNLDEGLKVVQTYPNNSFFTASGGVFVIAHLETLYNGFIDIKKGTTVIVEKLDTRNFRYVSDTQQSSATTKSSHQRDSGFLDLIPNVSLPGKQQVAITGSFPVAATCKWEHDVAATENRMVMIIRGFLVKGASI